MNEKTQNRINVIRALANCDAVYSRMLAQLRPMEQKYDAVLQKLPPEDQDAVCDFVSQCEAMSRRLLEIGCLWMTFPDEEKTPDR